MKDEALTIQEHLEELRKRVIHSVISIMIAFVAGWTFRRDILYLLKKPLLEALPEEMRHTILLKVIDKFFIDLKVAFIGALFLAGPYIVYQAWRFVAPGLYGHEKRLALPVMIFGSLFFFAGVAFCYFLVLPFAFSFLVQYSLAGADLFLNPEEAIGLADKLQIALREHISLTASILFAFGVAFETPVFMTVASMSGIASPEWFARQRKYALVGVFVFAAMLTPPDPWTQVALGFPLMLLYELGIRSTQLLVWFKGEPVDQTASEDKSPDSDKTSS